MDIAHLSPIADSIRILNGGQFASACKHFDDVLEQRRFLLVHGDAFDLARILPRESIDLIITSPPYWGQRSYGLDHNWRIIHEWRDAGFDDSQCPSYEWYRSHGGVLGLEPIPDWFVGHLADMFDCLEPSLKPAGSLWINLGDTYFARWASIRDLGRQGLGDTPRFRRRTPMGSYRQEKQLLLVPARFAIEMQQRRWILRNDLIWFKPNCPPRPEQDRLRLSHEHFFHFVKKPRQGRAKYYYDISEVEPGANDVVTCNVRSGTNGHTATFPEELVKPRIMSSCPPGGLILDPFCGTATAVCIAVRAGRRAIGFDVVKPYLAAADGRLKQRELF